MYTKHKIPKNACKITVAYVTPSTYISKSGMNRKSKIAFKAVAKLKLKKIK